MNCIYCLPLDNLGGHDTLLGIQIGRGLIDKVDVSGLAQAQDKGESLKLTTGKVDDLNERRTWLRKR